MYMRTFYSPDFVTHLIREKAPEILKQQTTINLTNQQFDDFMAACMDEAAVPSSRILEAAELERGGKLFSMCEQ